MKPQVETPTIPLTDNNNNNADAPKVTISFKVRPIVKIRLSQEAQSRGLTLSDLCESIIQTGNQIEELEALKKKIAAYESEELMQLFEAEKGETAEFSDSKGQKVTIKIESPEDVYKVVINSFKTEKK